MAAGLIYGGTELKAAKGVVSLFRRALQKTHTQSLKAINSIKTVSKLEKTQVPSHLAKLPEKILSGGKEGVPSLDALSKAGQVMDRAGLTKAGRALDKHGNRLNSPFPKATGNPASKNMQGQFHLNDILTDPKSVCIKNKSGEIKYYSPDSRGAHFWSDGTFKGFIERSYENY